MCNLSEGVWQKGLAEGRSLGLVEGKSLGLVEGKEEATLLSIKNLMDSVQWTVEQAMDALKISDPDREKYTALISKEK